jgi:hypothetical protein
LKAHPALHRDCFIRELLCGDPVTAGALQVIHAEIHGVVYRFAVLREFLFRGNEVRHFPLRQANGFASVTSKGYELPLPFRIRVSAMPKKLTLSPVCTKIEHPRMGSL